MPSKSSKAGLEAKSPSRRSSRSPGRSPGPKNRRKAAAQVSDYTSEGVQDYDIFELPKSDYKLMLCITALATIVRLFRIYQPSSVVFDEVHFGGFAMKYIKGKFFMDVHPPLAKLLITLAGFLGGFRGDFDFKEIGKDYLEPGVPYVAMRMLPAVLGILSVPTMFFTLKASGCRTITASLGALLVTFENGLVTQSRFILLDSPLVFFTALTVLSFTSFTNQHEQGPSKAFGPAWWFWLTATGLFLGATLSVKWVGLFTVAWVGSLTVLQLWVLLGDTRTVTVDIWFKHFFARAFCLIIIPLTMYLAMFAIHFLCLVNPGEGDGFMSSEFQATLNSKGMKDVPADVAFGSRVSIRHHNTQGGYLHSHSHMYPTGSKQQQITLYPHKDENNIWIMENQTQPLGSYGQVQGPHAWDNLTAGFIENGATIKLYHVTTDRRLHSHDHRPPVTEADWQNEVSAYGYEGFPGDANDLFRVEIVNSLSKGAEAKKRLRTIETKFKLVHVMSGCVLFSHPVKLPSWGFEQQEVTCAKGGSLPNSIWYVEHNEHPMFGPDVEKVNYRRPGFFAKFWELQRVMWRTNAGLVESHAWDSRPTSWPLLLRGINFWAKSHRQIYLIGNPLIWWASTASIVAYVIFKGLAVVRWQRGFGDYHNVNFKRFDYEIGQTVLGWAFHYFPFYLMARQLFLHHYLPALYFAIIAFCQIFDFVANRLTLCGSKKNTIAGSVFFVLFLAASIATFTLFSPLAYGNPWTQDACRKVKLLSSWDFDCNTFYTDLAQYSSIANVGSSQPKATVTPPKAPAQEPAPQQQKQPQEPPQRNGQQEQQKEKEKEPAEKAEFTMPAGQRVINSEESVEYRDQDGNLLDPEQVASMAKAGNVSFKTRYETRTRVIDGQGREVKQNVAPPHPDVEGQNPETVGKDNKNIPRDKPASVPGDEKSVPQEDQKPKPASEGKEATRNADEL
ncbi:dolichyl-phosphate-mannose-protein mannosyltransferase [Coccidioides immitis RS]|uniref:Dolichyl-phosphate-mannose--protein mannosyltransferase n=1 Tax=Coccidioides immitis (strain RS) TaxID=246410 RepID=A0A0E1RZU5_COCIM|nr:dolichyl-phosphate-mannose-protein mannosyltransferase [Coccidioides immitis RS]EAS35084.2 dolichyl-phosphate-mannose-protein mannosyltransferase [Coccidioides immitis RS]